MFVGTAFVVLALVGSLLQSGADEAYLHFMRASHFIREQKPSEALAELSRAIKLDSDSAVLHLTLGRVLLSLNRWDEALSSLETADELDPEDGDAAKAIGRILLGQLSAGIGGAEEQKRIEATLRKVLELEPDDVETLFYLSQLYELSAQQEKAVAIKKRILDINPRLSQMWLSLAKSYEQINDNLGRLDALKRAAELEPESPDLNRQVGEAAETVSALREAFAYYKIARDSLENQITDSPEDIATRLNLANLCLNNTRQFDIAAREFSRVIELARGNEDSYAATMEASIGLARALFYMDDFEPASRHFVQYEDMAINNFTSMAALVITYANTGRHEQAVEILDEITASMRSQPEAVAYLTRMKSRVLLEAGKSSEADSILEELITRDPQNVNNYLTLSQNRLGRKDFEGARRNLKRAIEIAGDTDQILFLKAVIAERSGSGEDADRILEDIINRNPEHHLALNFLGYSLAEKGTDLDRAQKYVEQALELQPYQGSYMDSLGWIHFKKGEYQLAEKHLTEAMPTKYRTAEVREHLGYLYMATGRPEKALEEFRAALDLNLAEVKSTADVELQIEKLNTRIQH